MQPNLRPLSALFLLTLGLVIGYAIESSGRSLPGAEILPCVKSFVIPSYPPLARQARIVGDVRATLHIGPDGAVESVSEVEGPSLLRDGSVEAMKSWKFGIAAGSRTQLRMTFRYLLKGKEARECFVYEVSGHLPNFVEIATNPTEAPGPDQIEPAKKP